MLGIGFIITHFVAMQKPQQRKYHSSCNRSVHRGTAHGKQKVKVCKRKTPHLFLMRSFLFPYGDKLQSIVKLASAIARYALSSPCGDSTGNRLICRAFNGFSPPYGDGTSTMGVKPTTFEFSPPYGDGTAIPWPADDWKRFSPPYGDSTDFDKYGIVELTFSPPYGDGTEDNYFNSPVCRFSPPCGDCTSALAVFVSMVTFSSPYGAAPLYHGSRTIEIPFQGVP